MHEEIKVNFRCRRCSQYHTMTYEFEIGTAINYACGCGSVIELSLRKNGLVLAKQEEVVGWSKSR